MAVAGRWRDPAAFRADPTAAPAARPSRRQSVALLAVLALVAGVIAVLAVVLRPDHARSFDLLHGSLILADSAAPVAVDLASGRPTVRLAQANDLVGAKTPADLAVVPTSGGTLLLGRTTGEFNMVGLTGFPVKQQGGVQLPALANSTAAGVAAQDYSYIVQSAPASTAVYLVGASTVQAASGAGATVKPRASLTLRGSAVSTDPGAVASAGNDLWMLVGRDATRTIDHLVLPPGSSTGATLQERRTGSVDGAAAIATAGSGTRQTVGVASRNRIVVFRGSTQLATARWDAPAGVDQVLPASNNTTRLSFLLHSGSGWSVVSTRADGTGLQGPTRLAAIEPTAHLIAPAADRGTLYTMATDDPGDLITIDGGRASALAGAEVYPQTSQDGRTVESAPFTDAYVVARGARVIYNSPDHQRALVVFTDGSRPPLAIQKNSAVTVNAAGGAAALTQGRLTSPTAKTATKPGVRQPKAVTPVNNRIDCTSTSVKPHIPLFGQPVPGSRSVLLSWNYPAAGRQDCYPSTYVLTVKTLSDGAPEAPSSVTVQGQTSVNLTGLFPSTSYEITVTAYINGSGTASQPIRITTGPEGPAAPRDVTVSTDADGNWHIGWSACGSTNDGCVPSASWTVIPQFCDGRGLSGAPDPLSVAADPASVTQPGATLTGGDALLGRGVRFTVEGIGDQGAVGTPSGSTACTTSWRPSSPAGMTLSASRPPNAVAGSTTSTTVALDLGANAVHDVGGVGGQIVLRLTGPDGTQSFTQAFDGRTNTVSKVFTNLRPGATYNATAAISPPGHPDRGAPLGPQPVITRADWPGITLSGVGCARNPLPALSCDLSFTVGGVSSAGAGGETFDLTSDSMLRCGQSSLTIVRTGFDPANGPITVRNVSQLSDLFGSCTLSVALAEHPPLTSYFGGTTSGTVTAPVDLGAPTTSGAGGGEFAAAWNGAGVRVDYTGGNPLLTTLTTNWHETVLAPDGSSCGTQAAAPTTTVPVDQGCINQQGTSSGWSLTISYIDTLGGAPHTATITVPGLPPTYRPCNPGALSATWGATKADGVTVSASGDISGCGNWTFALLDPTGTDCTGAVSGPAPPATIQLGCGTPPSSGDWTVTVTWTRTDGTPDHANPPPTVTGVPPTT